VNRAVAALLALALADVVPRCGSCGSREPDVVTMAPWHECGWHGPREQLVCRAPARCFGLSRAAHLEDGVTASRACTVRCKSDADCASMGAGFACTALGSEGADYEVSVCARLEHDGGL
jgi:hypothetical protein